MRAATSGKPACTQRMRERMRQHVRMDTADARVNELDAPTSFVDTDTNELDAHAYPVETSANGSDTRAYAIDTGANARHTRPISMHTRASKLYTRASNSYSHASRLYTRRYVTHTRPYPTHTRPHPTHMRAYPTHARPHPTHTRAYTSHTRAFPLRTRAHPLHSRTQPADGRAWRRHTCSSLRHTDVRKGVMSAKREESSATLSNESRHLTNRRKKSAACRDQSGPRVSLTGEGHRSGRQPRNGVWGSRGGHPRTAPAATKRRSRIHLVAIHVSPRSTGHPAECSGVGPRSGELTRREERREVTRTAGATQPREWEAGRRVGKVNFTNPIAVEVRR